MTRFNIGDKVKFLNELGEGLVKGYSNKNKVIVETTDGLEISFPENQLIILNEEIKFGSAHFRKVHKEPIIKSRSKSSKDHLKSLTKEVDLHAEELIENFSHLSNFEIMTMQLQKFKSELDKGMRNNLKKIIFIHGVGNGRLKQEIISILKNTEGISFQDASYREYGRGATQVNIL